MHYVCETCGALGPPDGEGYHVQVEVHYGMHRAPYVLNTRCGKWVRAEPPTPLGDKKEAGNDNAT